MLGDVIPRDFFDRDVVAVARELLGKLLVRRTREGTCVGRIVETEAYLAQNDPACHGHRGPTKRNASMFGPPGFAYVYPIHSRYCLNAVTEAVGHASAVLVRAVEPVTGIELMQHRRGTDRLLDLCRGPARLCEALAVDRALDGWDLTRGERIWLANDPAPFASTLRLAKSMRIGVTSAQTAELRFFAHGSPYVSGPRYLHR